MNTLIYRAALAASLALATAQASAAATVNYIDVDKMSDVPRYQSDREFMQDDLREYIEKLSTKLPAGQQLKLDILDIDLAGDVFPRVAIHDVRVYRGRADWPRIHLRYSIEQDGKVIRSGETTLSDPNYQMSFNRHTNDTYGYEKQMFDDWFRKDLLAAH